MSRILPLAVVLSLTSFASAQDWSRFRGPNGSGVAAVEGLPDRLDEDTLAWRTELAPGHSSPVVHSGRVFLTAQEGEELVTIALDAETGEPLWSAAAPPTEIAKIDGRNHPASPSAAVDEERVVVFFPDFGLLAYDHEGNELWKHPLGPFQNVYGMGASPILAGSLVVLACDQSLGSFLLALDASTGEVAWRVERPRAKSGHCTPILHETEEGVRELLLPGSFFLDAYDVTSGAKRWSASGLSFEMKSVPVLADGLVFVNGYGSPMNQPGNQITVRPFEEVLDENDADGSGTLSREEMPATRAAAWFDFVDLDADGTLGEADWAYLSRALGSLNGMLAFRLDGAAGERDQEGLAWAYRRAVPQLPSPLIVDDVLYMLADGGGILTTFRPSTGEVLQKGRLAEAAGDEFYASPVAGDGKVYLVSLSGSVFVLPTGGSLEPLSVTSLEERVFATPALQDGRVLVRTESALFAFGG